jgi:tetratricopeptide (TPR) repeat protein
MECDDVALLLARDPAGLSDAEAIALDEHVASCEVCFELARERVAALAAPMIGGGASAAAPLVLRPVDPASFEVGEEIAAGGMGRILRAYDRRLGREVALKEVLAPSMRARFEREAMITARLQHPAIVPIYEAGTWPDGTAFYTMRLVPGETLTRAIERRPALAERLAVLPHVTAVCEALAYAHSRGVIHRDLKPHNVLIGEFGETVVIDWGLAKQRGVAEVAGGVAAESEAWLTQAGTVVGTPCFMAPEQARGEELDERADVFALGAMLYNLIAGAPPYWDRSHDSKELVAEVLARPPTPIGALAPAVPADLRAIVERAMARDPAERYADAAQLAAELARFQAGQLLLSREYSGRDLLVRWIRKHRALVALGGAAAIALAVVGVVAIRNAVRARDAEHEAKTALEVGERRGQRKLCAASGPQLATPWTAEAKGHVQRRFAAVTGGYGAQAFERVDRELARWSGELATTRELVCSDGEQLRARLAVELDCLTDRVRGARALIAQLHDADKATVLNAIAAAEGLPPIARCTVAPPDRAVVPDSPPIAAVRELFARSHALLDLGKARDALPIAQEAMKGADAAGDLGLRAAARVAVGAAQAAVSDYDHAIPTLHEALRLAESARDDRSRAQAWVNLVRIEYQRGKPEPAVAMQAAALGAAERIDDVYLQTEIMLFLGGALGQLGKPAEARAQLERAVTLRRETYGDRDRRLAAALSSLGNAYAMKGDLDLGIAAHREAAEIAEAALGAGHPSVGVMIGNLGSDYTYGLRGAEAVAQFERSLAIAEAAHGAKHRDIAMALTNLGTAQYHAGRHEAALATFARAEAAWREVNAKHPSLAEVLCGRYLAQQALGKPASVADLEAALELGKVLPPFIRARIELALGKAASGPRALALVKASAAGFATSTLPLSQRELADANAWLAKRGGG